jgi:structural maintenance of chromosome 1
LALVTFKCSSSGALKEEYDRLKQQMQKAQEEINFAYQKKKGINAERKEARLEKEEADKYARLKDDLVPGFIDFLSVLIDFVVVE